MIPEELRKGLGSEPGGVFYLHGDDEYRKEEAARALTEAHLDSATRDFNHDLLRGSEVSVETLASTLGTPPMMAEWRVVVIRDVQGLAASPRARSVLVKAAEGPPPGLALILLAAEPRSPGRFYKDLRGKARSLAFRSPSRNDLPAWLMDWCRERFDRELDEGAARALAQAIGADVAVLTRELEKLTTVVREGETVTREAVEAAGTRLPRQDRWQWLDLVGEGRFGEALGGLPVLLGHGETGVGLVIGLGTHLLRIGVALEGGAPALKEVLARNQAFLVSRYVAQARRWTPEELEAALDGLLEVDAVLKSSALPDERVVERWLLERMAAREAAA